MAGLQKGDPRPTEIRLLTKSRILEISFDDGSTFALSCEFLRVYSPSAEVRGHGPGQEVLQTGKSAVEILELEPVGNYAIRPRFSDGHDTGLYSWDYLYDLGKNQDALWRRYLEKMHKAGADRQPQASAAPSAPAGKTGWQKL
ncbi:MAG: gamma-butyrobetaine hydroxylase-like domain-containing protein [Burkholderiales bacterium]